MLDHISDENEHISIEIFRMRLETKMCENFKNLYYVTLHHNLLLTIYLLIFTNNFTIDIKINFDFKII